MKRGKSRPSRSLVQENRPEQCSPRTLDGFETSWWSILDEGTSRVSHALQRHVKRKKGMLGCSGCCRWQEGTRACSNEGSVRRIVEGEELVKLMGEQGEGRVQRGGGGPEGSVGILVHLCHWEDRQSRKEREERKERAVVVHDDDDYGGNGRRRKQIDLGGCCCYYQHAFATSKGGLYCHCCRCVCVGTGVGGGDASAMEMRQLRKSLCGCRWRVPMWRPVRQRSGVGEQGLPLQV